MPTKLPPEFSTSHFFVILIFDVDCYHHIKIISLIMITVMIKIFILKIIRKTSPWEAGRRLPPWLWHLPCFPCYGTAPLYGLKVRPAQHNHHNQSHYQHGRPYYFGQILLIINLSSTTVKRAAVVVEGFFPFLIGKPFFMDFWAERSSVFCRVEMLKHVLRILPCRILHFFHLS